MGEEEKQWTERDFLIRAAWLTKQTTHVHNLEMSNHGSQQENPSPIKTEEIFSNVPEIVSFSSFLLAFGFLACSLGVKILIVSEQKHISLRVVFLTQQSDLFPPSFHPQNRTEMFLSGFWGTKSSL